MKLKKNLFCSTTSVGEGEKLSTHTHVMVHGIWQK